MGRREHRVTREAFVFGDASKSGVPAGFHRIIDMITADINVMPLRRNLGEQQVMLEKICSAYLQRRSKVLEITDAELAAAEAAIDPPSPSRSGPGGAAAATPAPIHAAPARSDSGGASGGEASGGGASAVSPGDPLRDCASVSTDSDVALWLDANWDDCDPEDRGKLAQWLKSQGYRSIDAAKEEVADDAEAWDEILAKCKEIGIGRGFRKRLRDVLGAS